MWPQEMEQLFFFLWGNDGIANSNAGGHYMQLQFPETYGFVYIFHYAIPLSLQMTVMSRALPSFTMMINCGKDLKKKYLKHLNCFLRQMRI